MRVVVAERWILRLLRTDIKAKFAEPQNKPTIDRVVEHYRLHSYSSLLVAARSNFVFYAAVLGEL
jgi:hypothetical protein